MNTVVFIHTLVKLMALCASLHSYYPDSKWKIVVVCHVQFSLVPHNIHGNKTVREHMEHIVTGNIHERIKSFVHWKHVHLVVWGRVFQRNLN